MRDARPRRGRANAPGRVVWHPAWAWPKDTRAFVRRLVHEAPRPVVHFCSGSSRVGDVRVDLYHPAADVCADARRPPFRGIGTALIDPPWNIRPEHRFSLMNAVIGTIRPGGQLLLIAPWLVQRSKLVELQDVWVRTHRMKRGQPFPGLTLLTRYVRVSTEEP
jgi:hypothetical protein